MLHSLFSRSLLGLAPSDCRIHIIGDRLSRLEAAFCCGRLYVQKHDEDNRGSQAAVRPEVALR